MKVVINECHGGFGLSAEAMKLLIKRGASGVKATPMAEYYRVGKPDDPLRDVGDGYQSTDWIQDVLHKDGIVYTHEDNEPEYRADPMLVRVVEELGSEASGACANLVIVEIPDDVDWHIDEYDGFEHVAENHRTWSSDGEAWANGKY